MQRLSLDLTNQDFHDLCLVANMAKGAIKIHRDVLMKLVMDHGKALAELQRRGVQVVSPDDEAKEKPKLRRSKGRSAHRSTAEAV